MAHDLIIFSGVTLVFSIIILWITSLSMIRDRSILDYMAFFVLGLVLVFQSSLMAFQFFWNMSWIFFEVIVFVNLLWIFFVLRRFAKDGHS